MSPPLRSHCRHIVAVKDEFKCREVLVDKDNSEENFERLTFIHRRTQCS